MPTITLPEGYAARPPTLADAAAVASLIAVCQQATGDKATMTAEEQANDWQSLDLADEAIAVTAPDGQIAGYADLYNRRYVRVSVYGYTHPSYRGQGIGAFLAQWGEAWTRERIGRAPVGARVVVEQYVRTTNDSAIRLMQTRGYTPVRGIYVMAITLDAPPPAPAPPADISIRAFIPGADERATFDAVEEAFQDTWNRPPGIFERWLAMTQTERTDPDLWFLAIDQPTGEIAGVSLGKVTAGEGWIGAVGVRRPWRNRGLALALLHAIFAEYYRRGVREVNLSVDAESPTGAPRLYSRAGMRVAQSYALYRTELRAGTDLLPSHENV